MQIFAIYADGLANVRYDPLSRWKELKWRRRRSFHLPFQCLSLLRLFVSRWPSPQLYHQITMTYNYYIATYNHLNCLTCRRRRRRRPSAPIPPEWQEIARIISCCPRDFHLRLLLRVIQQCRRLLSTPIQRWRRSIGVHRDSWPPTHDIRVSRSLVYHNFHFINRYRARPIHRRFAISENLRFYVLRVKVESGGDCEISNC